MHTASPIDPHWPALLERLAGALDLDASARASGAIRRRRAVADGPTLLRLALAHGPGGLSLRAAAWAGLAGVAALSDVALRKRLRGAADWLGQVAGALLRRRASPAGTEPPGRLRLRVVDGTSFGHPGARGAVWRLQAAYDPAAGRFADLRLTGADAGEGFARLGLAPGDVVLGDRGYARPRALQGVLAAGADFVVRVGWSSLRILGPDGAPLDWPAVFGALAPGEAAERPVVVTPHDRRRRLFAARLVVLRHARAATGARALHGLRRNHSRRRSRRALQPLTLASTGYLMLLTSLPAAAADAAGVLAMYRLRWQIELAFKRLKGGLGMSRLLARDPKMARSWLLAHLILALAVEDAAEEVLDAPPVRRAEPTRPVSLWRLHGALRRAILAVVLRPAAPSALARAAALVVRHICDPPRRRPSQSAAARRG